MPRSRQPGQLDVVHILAADEFSPHNPRKAGNKSDAQRNDHISRPRAKETDEHQCKQNARERKHNIVHAHQYFIQQAAEISGKRPEQNTAESPDRHCSDRNQQRGSASRHHAA